MTNHLGKFDIRFAEEEYDYGFLIGLCLEIKKNNFRWRHAVMFYSYDGSKDYDVYAAEKILLNRFYRYIGAM